MNWRMALLLAGVAAVSMGSNLAEQNSAWWTILVFIGTIACLIAAAPAVKL